MIYCKLVYLTPLCMFYQEKSGNPEGYNDELEIRSWSQFISPIQHVGQSKVKT
jgi:hypothetical protein